MKPNQPIPVTAATINFFTDANANKHLFGSLVERCLRGMSKDKARDELAVCRSLKGVALDPRDSEVLHITHGLLGQYCCDFSAALGYEAMAALYVEGNFTLDELRETYAFVHDSFGHKWPTEEAA